MLFSMIEQESSMNQNKQRLQDRFHYHFDQSSKSFDQSKILNLEFLLRKFQNLNFYFINFMKQYSPNSNIIITTYSCIYLYIQHVGLSKIASPFGHSQSTPPPLMSTQVLACGAQTFGWGITLIPFVMITP